MNYHYPRFNQWIGLVRQKVGNIILSLSVGAFCKVSFQHVQPSLRCFKIQGTCWHPCLYLLYRKPILYSHPESMPVYLQDSCHIGGWWPYQWPSCFNVKMLECSCWLVVSTTLNSMLCIGDHYPILLKIMGHEMSWIIRFLTYIIW